MSELTSKELMEALHGHVAKALTDKVKSKECTAADLNAAIKFLKDNGIESKMTPGSPIESLSRNLPQFDDSDEAFDMSTQSVQ